MPLDAAQLPAGIQLSNGQIIGFQSLSAMTCVLPVCHCHPKAANAPHFVTSQETASPEVARPIWDSFLRFERRAGTMEACAKLEVGISSHSHDWVDNVLWHLKAFIIVPSPLDYSCRVGCKFHKVMT
eukprot:scaffold229207_cov18-Prasinocladus_malaysianus.AAC.1